LGFADRFSYPLANVSAAAESWLSQDFREADHASVRR
jgi:hypothetical protein